MRRVAIVTGSASGLGVQTVLKLAKKGHNVIINYRNSAEKAVALQKRAAGWGGKISVIQGDVTSKEDCETIVGETIRRFGRVDILIHNAGPYIFERKKMMDYTDEEWRQMVDGNLSSVFYITRAAIGTMRKQKWGRIITFGFNQSSQAPAWVGRGAFASAKVGLVSMTKTLAQEESENGITVNMVCPGDISDPYKHQSIGEVRRDHYGKRREESTSGDPRTAVGDAGQTHVEHQGEETEMAPVGRPGAGGDIARVIEFLCHNDADFITGSVIEVNGGFDVLQKHKQKGS